MEFLKPMGDEIIHMLSPLDKEIVLDVAAGTGEPGLTIAQMIPGGKVLVTDLAEGMLEVAKENAARRGIRNIETVACDVSQMPFSDNYFNAISCRMGFMFFPDMLLAANEMVRVLKPGGRMATSVWSIPEKNLWTTAIMGTINKHMQLPSLPAGAPGMFRCAKPGLMADLFSQAGLKNISEKEIAGTVDYGSIDFFWTFMNEVAAPVVAAMSKCDESVKATIKKEVFDLVKQKNPDGKALLDFASVVIYGEK